MNASAFSMCFAPLGIAIESTHVNAPDDGITYSTFLFVGLDREHVA